MLEEFGSTREREFAFIEASYHLPETLDNCLWILIYQANKRSWIFILTELGPSCRQTCRRQYYHEGGKVRIQRVRKINQIFLAILVVDNVNSPTVVLHELCGLTSGRRDD